MFTCLRKTGDGDLLNFCGGQLCTGTLLANWSFGQLHKYLFKDPTHRKERCYHHTVIRITVWSIPGLAPARAPCLYKVGC